MVNGFLNNSAAMLQTMRNSMRHFAPKKYLPHLALLLITSVLIFYRLNVPQALIFDETYHIPSAQKYLNGVFYQENHPPIGKLLIAFGQLLYGGEIRPDFVGVEKISAPWPKDFDITGFRIAPALFGIFIPLILFLVLKTITGNTITSWLMALLLCFDTAFLMQARIAMLDVFLLFFVFLSTLFFVRAFLTEKPVSFFELAMFGVVSGCAANVKDTGLIVLVPFGLLTLKTLRQKSFSQTLSLTSIFLTCFAITYLGWWLIHFSIANTLYEDKTYKISQEHRDILTGDVAPPNPIRTFYIEMVDAFKFSKQYNEGVPALKLGNPEEVGSPWYYWVMGGTAINYRWETPNGIDYRYSYLVPNPVTWMVSLLGVIFGSSLVLSDLLYRFLNPGKLKTFLYAFVTLYWCYIVPFWFIKRVMYLYHYLPAMLLGLILFAVFVKLAPFKSGHKRSFIVLLVLIAGIVCLLLLSFIYYQPLTNAEFQLRNFWPFWKLMCVKCG